MIEDEFCGLFAQQIRNSPSFTEWVLGHTKFAHVAAEARLLAEELEKRKAKFWWRHWWARVPEVGRESETDILLLFGIGDAVERFAIHVEAKVDAVFSPFQPQDYAARGRQMATDPRLLYSDFDTVIIAPRLYLERYPVECGHFGSAISFEDIAAHIPAFAF